MPRRNGTPGAAIGDQALGIQGAEIRPRCHVATLQFQPEPQRGVPDGSRWERIGGAPMVLTMW